MHQKEIKRVLTKPSDFVLNFSSSGLGNFETAPSNNDYIIKALI